MELIFTFLLNLFFTAFVYLLVPIIIVFTKKKYDKKFLKRIIIINGACGFGFFAILYSLLGNDEIPNAFATFLWSSTAYAILKRTSYVDNTNSEEDKLGNFSNRYYENQQNQPTHICLSNTDEQPKSHGNFNIYGKDITVQKFEHTRQNESLEPVVQPHKIEFNAFDIAKTLSDKCAKTVIQLNRKCCEIGIDYNERKLAIASFAYFFAQWTYDNKNTTFVQVAEVQRIYKEQFNEFNKVAFQDDSYKSVIENEQMFAETLERFLCYAKEFYNSENDSFSRKMMERYIIEFIENESDIATLKKYL